MAKAFTDGAGATGDFEAFAGQVRFYGFSFSEDAATPAAARVRVHDAASAADATDDNCFLDVHIPLSESRERLPVTYPVALDEGCVVDRVSGETRVVVYLG